MRDARRAATLAGALGRPLRHLSGWGIKGQEFLFVAALGYSDRVWSSSSSLPIAADANRVCSTCSSLNVQLRSLLFGLAAIGSETGEAIMRFKKPFKAVPIRPDPAYLAKRNQRTEPQCHVSPVVGFDDERPSPSPTNYEYRLQPKSGSSGGWLIILAGIVIGGLIGVWSIAYENGGWAAVRAWAADAGLVRKREPQVGDYWSGCNSARAAGTAPIYASEPGYRTDMDGDGDGIACEPYRP